ncbi:MAG: fumarate hydratase C-terminal domain-containing protein [Pseudomonadota bacterium]|nr:fumarate hydratase C-terminal domain-containing protein [Pseudomonadota bacterium]
MGERAKKLKQVNLKTPVSQDDLEKLEIGSVAFLSGLIYTAREGVYEKILTGGEKPPVDFTGLTNVNFHCAPAASKNDDGSYNVGAVTATASFRFAKYLKRWFAETGTRVIIGKGGMNQGHYNDLFVPAGAVYLTTVGYGTGALLGRGIKGVEAVNWLDELGIAQAMWILRVENFGPLLVESDIKGNSLFERNNAEVNKRVEGLYEGLRPPALSRYGETDRKTDELI